MAAAAGARGVAPQHPPPPPPSQPRGVPAQSRLPVAVAVGSGVRGGELPGDPRTLARAAPASRTAHPRAQIVTGRLCPGSGSLCCLGPG